MFVVSRRIFSWTTSSRAARTFDPSYQFFLRPIPSLSLSLSSRPASLILSRSPSRSLAQALQPCRRQAVWSVYSSVASPPLSISPSLLVEKSLFPSLAVRSSLAYLHRRRRCRRCSTHGHVPYLSCGVVRVRYLSRVRMRYTRRRPSPSFARLGKSFKTGTVLAENTRTASEPPFLHPIVPRLFRKWRDLGN